MKFTKSAAALVTAAALALPAHAQDAAAPQPKIAPLVWTLLSSAVQAAFPSFTNWLTGDRQAQGNQYVAGPGLATATMQPYGQLNTGIPPGGSFVTALASIAGNMLGNAMSGNNTAITPVLNPVILGQPDIPLRTADGQPNYQGLHLAVVSVDPDGQNARLRSLAEGFKTGERFKLRVVSTFDSVAVIDNVNPAGLRSRLYPAPTAGEQVVFLKAGQPVLLPLAADQFFEFANMKGVEQLQITVRDPRSVAGLSNQPIYRQDAAWGSNLMQLTPPGAYAGFTQTLSLMHM